MVALWVPMPLLAALDAAVKAEDSDRSKFIRQAIRQRVGAILQGDQPNQESN